MDLRGDNGRVHIIDTRSNVTAVLVVCKSCDHLVAAARVLNGEHISIKTIDCLQRDAQESAPDMRPPDVS